jgi:hypothetical protein
VPETGTRDRSPLGRRLIVAAQLGMIAIGVCLIVLALRRSPAGGAPRPQPPPPNAEWVARAPRREIFTSLIQPVAETAADGAQAEDDLLTRTFRDEARRLAEALAATSRIRLRRVTARGLEYDSRLDLDWTRQGEGGMAVLVVSREEREVVRYRARVRGDRLQRLELALPAPAQGYQEVRVDDDLPITLGDVPVRYVLALHRAALEGRVRRLGTLAGRNAVPLAVFDLDLTLTEPATAREAREDFTGKGASALVYLDAESLLPRTVRVFDAGGRLVRTYTDLVFTGPAEAPQLAGASVRSIPTGGSTAVVVEAVQIAAGAAHPSP